MSNDACPVPGRPENSQIRQAIERMLAAQRIAVVGLSDDPSRPSYGVAAYLARAGKDVLPVNPKYQQVMGRRCFAALEDIPDAIDLVNIFRRPEHCPDVVRSAIAVNAKGVWLQSGIVSPESEQLAREAGLDFVQDRCLKIELMYRG